MTRVLVIDDSENVRCTLKMTLEFKECEVVEAEDGQEGLDALANGAFDLVFCDLAMPGMHGEEVIRRARQDLGLNDLAIVVLSAETRDAKDRALTAGATAFMDKPFVAPQIFEVLDKYAR